MMEQNSSSREGDDGADNRKRKSNAEDQSAAVQGDDPIPSKRPAVAKTGDLFQAQIGIGSRSPSSQAAQAPTSLVPTSQGPSWSSSLAELHRQRQLQDLVANSQTLQLLSMQQQSDPLHSVRAGFRDSSLASAVGGSLSPNEGVSDEIMQYLMSMNVLQQQRSTLPFQHANIASYPGYGAMGHGPNPFSRYPLDGSVAATGLSQLALGDGLQNRFQGGIPGLGPTLFPGPGLSQYHASLAEAQRLSAQVGVSPMNTLPPAGNYEVHSMQRSGIPHRLPVVLALHDDHLKLSNHQVLLRHQIEAFQASEDDVSTHTRGRNKPITLGQVGIRCRHCAHVPVGRRQKGSTYFPATTLGLYQAAQNMSTTHMQCGLCTEMPTDIKQQFAKLMSTKVVSSGAGRPYWAKSAEKLGLVDTSDGIRFIRDIPPGTQIGQPASPAR